MLSIFRGTTVPALEQTASFAETRHSLLAGNIANLDTPNYQARDLSVNSFQQALAGAIERNHSASYSTDQIDPMVQVGEGVDQLLYHDGGDLNLERQVTEMAKNQQMHNLAVSLMRNQFQVLQTAISERVV